MRSLRVVLAGCVLAGSLAGCADPEPVPDPVLVWVDGEPDGPLESDPWVRAVRAAELAAVLALNSGDFAREDLAATWHPSTIDKFADEVGYAARDDEAEVFLGPWPFTPLLVEVADDGRKAEVVGCSDAYEKVQEVPRSDGIRWPTVTVQYLDLGTDGQPRLFGGGSPVEDYILPDGALLTPEYCDTVPIARGVLDPPPDLEVLKAKSRDDIILPPSPSPTGAG